MFMQQGPPRSANVGGGGFNQGPNMLQGPLAYLEKTTSNIGKSRLKTKITIKIDHEIVSFRKKQEIMKIGSGSRLDQSLVTILCVIINLWQILQEWVMVGDDEDEAGGEDGVEEEDVDVAEKALPSFMVLH